MNIIYALTKHFSTITYIALIVRIGAIGCAITSLELLLRPFNLDDCGLMSWRISRLDFPWLIKGVIAAHLDRLLAYPTILVLLVARLMIACLQIIGPVNVILHPLIVWTAALLGLTIPLRSRYGLDGADQVGVLIFGGLALVDIAPTATDQGAYLLFLVSQCCLSYSVAGVAKLISPGWRDGTYLPQILCIKTYCHPAIAHFARNHLRVMWFISWGIICWECLFPVILVVPMHYALLIITVGIAFHVALAILMGLNDFIWAFCALYPAVVFYLTARPW